jgi:hypothetical protein
MKKNLKVCLADFNVIDLQNTGARYYTPQSQEEKQPRMGERALQGFAAKPHRRPLPAVLALVGDVLHFPPFCSSVFKL